MKVVSLEQAQGFGAGSQATTALSVALENGRTKARTVARLQSEARTHKRVWFQFASFWMYSCSGTEGCRSLVTGSGQ